MLPAVRQGGRPGAGGLFIGKVLTSPVYDPPGTSAWKRDL